MATEEIRGRKAYNDGYHGNPAPEGTTEKSLGVSGVVYRAWKKGKDDKAAGKPYDNRFYVALPAAIGPAVLAAKPVPLPTAPPAEGGRKRRGKSKKTKGKRKAKKSVTRRR